MNPNSSHNDEVFNNLKDIIVSNLLPLIDNDYSLLDIPNHNNIGDNLILGGEFELLAQSPFRLLYKSSMQHGKDDDIPREGIILMHGGGNFGDIWPGSHIYRRRIISKRTNQKVIIFPQTVYYKDVQAVNEDVRIYGSHPDLTICARDKQSFYYLKKHFLNNNILLVPDMAFVLGKLGRISSMKGAGKKELLFLNRTDKELSTNDNYLTVIKERFPDRNPFITDWPLLNPKSNFSERIYWKRHEFQKRLIEKIEKTVFKSILIDDCYGLGKRNKHIQLIDSGIDLFDKYEVIFTNRLHGMILGLLLGKAVHCFDNNYGKNSGFYDTWLSSLEKCELIQKI